MNYKLNDAKLTLVCNVIASNTGLQFPAGRWPVLRRSLVFAARDFGYNDINSFIEWLISADLNKDQIETLATSLTCSETCFWSEPNTFSALTDSIIPELIGLKKNNKRSIRIWSAGCSTGEEPYSIAMAISKAINIPHDWDITILATDINPVVIDKARAGIYGQWSFRNTPGWLKSNYFDLREDRKYEIIPKIRKMVTFSSMNLIEMAALDTENVFDIIFCRNVLMYFTADWAEKVAYNIFHSLTPDGWLSVSSSELSSPHLRQFSTVNFPGAILYRKVNMENLPPMPYIVEEVSHKLSLGSALITQAEEESILNETQIVL